MFGIQAWDQKVIFDYLGSGIRVSKAVKSSISVIALSVASSPSSAISFWSGVLRKRHSANDINWYYS